MKAVTVKNTPPVASAERYGPNYRPDRNDEPTPVKLVDPMTEAMAYNRPQVFAYEQETIHNALLAVKPNTTVVVECAGRVEQWSFGYYYDEQGVLVLTDQNKTRRLYRDDIKLVYAGFPFHTDSVLVLID